MEGLLAYISAWQALRAITRKVVLFPRWRAERVIGHEAVAIFQQMLTGEPSGLPPPPDGRKYAA
jgi:hypothetical protein